MNENLSEDTRFAQELAVLVFSGMDVWEELQRDSRALQRTSPENVGDVLDALVRLARARAFCGRVEHE